MMDHLLSNQPPLYLGGPFLAQLKKRAFYKHDYFCAELRVGGSDYAQAPPRIAPWPTPVVGYWLRRLMIRLA